MLFNPVNIGYEVAMAKLEFTICKAKKKIAVNKSYIDLWIKATNVQEGALNDVIST